MDYRVFLNDIIANESPFNSFINNRVSKNISIIEDIIDSYLDEMKNDKFSIKSYKAKIIHNELGRSSSG